MKSKHEILNKFDYMKAYSFNLILTEKTNGELEHEKNVGKIDGAFYRNFSWQIMGKKKERQLSNIEAKDVAKAKKQEGLTESPPVANGRLQDISLILPSMLIILFLTILLVITICNMIVPSKPVERRYKFAPAKIKKCPKTNRIFVEVLERDVRVKTQSDDEEKLVYTKTDLSGSAPKRYTTTCYFKPKTIPAWYTESLLIYIGSTKRRYDEKVWFKHTLQPYYWSENMMTEVNVHFTKPHVSEVVIPTEKSDVHYMSLESQQPTVSAN